jgi:hypothetical protein
MVCRHTKTSQLSVAMLSGFLGAILIIFIHRKGSQR